MADLAPDQIREQLNRIMASKEFENSERLNRFLRFTVEALLNGEQDQVKEYSIGKAVFDRNDEYDPRLDPIVRVEARRLRKKLDEYYAAGGIDDPIRIHLPKGSYLASAEAATHLSPPRHVEPLQRTWRWIAVSAVVLSVAAILIYLLNRPAPAPPELAVFPARWLWQNEDFPEIRHDEDLAERVAIELARRGRAVTSWPSIQRFRSGQFNSTSAVAEALKIKRILIVAVRVEADGFRVTCYLIDAVGGRKLNVSDDRNVLLQTPEAREREAAAIAAALAHW